MPIAMPAAPKASAATSPRPSLKPPAAMTGTSTRVDAPAGSRSDVGIDAGVPAALAALRDHRVGAELRRLLGVRGAPQVGTQSDAGRP